MEVIDNLESQVVIQDQAGLLASLSQIESQDLIDFVHHVCVFRQVREFCFDLVSSHVDGVHPELLLFLVDKSIGVTPIRGHGSI